MYKHIFRKITQQTNLKSGPSVLVECYLFQLLLNRCLLPPILSNNFIKTADFRPKEEPLFSRVTDLHLINHCSNLSFLYLKCHDQSSSNLLDLEWVLPILVVLFNRILFNTDWSRNDQLPKTTQVFDAFFIKFPWSLATIMRLRALKSEGFHHLS